MRAVVMKLSIKLVAIIVLSIITATLIDPYLRLGSPIFAQLTNGAIPVLLMLFVWGLSGRLWIALISEIVFLGVLRYVDHMKFMYLDADLVYADLTIIWELLKDPRLIFGFVQLTPKTIAAVLLVVVVSIATLVLARRWPKTSAQFRITCSVTALTALSILWMQHAPAVIPMLQWEVFIQSTGANRVGVSGNILLGRMTTRDVARAVTLTKEKAFWNEPLVKQAQQQLSAHQNVVRPDIVIVQSESLFEPSQLCGFSDNPILKRISQEEPASPDNFLVPVFGGRTLQTEFEVLTGAPISFFPGSMFAYYELMGHPITALPKVLNNLGYETTVIHPGNRGFWDRNSVMPDMGFQSFLDARAFITPNEWSDREHVDDQVLMRAVLAELDTSNRPVFVMAITINNHGPWGDYAPKEDSKLGLPSQLTGEARRQMADYVSNAIKADDAYGYLLDALRRRGRPTIVAIYGDHLPGLASVYEKLCFKDRKPPNQHFPPYRIWANFPIPIAPRVTSSYLLQGWLLYAAGLPLNGQMLANAITGLVEQNDAILKLDRDRIADEYANIAASNVYAVDTSGNNTAHTVFINGDQAWEILRNDQDRASELSQGRFGDDGVGLILSPVSGKPVDFTLNLAGGYASMTLRPYLQCAAQGALVRGEVSFTADKRLLYKASLGPNLLRLVTLDLQGVKHLSIHADMVPDSGCDGVRIKIAQMICYSANCSTPGPGRHDVVAANSRLLSKDPAINDPGAFTKLKAGSSIWRQ